MQFKEPGGKIVGICFSIINIPSGKTPGIMLFGRRGGGGERGTRLRGGKRRGIAVKGGLHLSKGVRDIVHTSFTYVDGNFKHT